MFWNRKRLRAASTPIVVAPRWDWIRGRRHLTESPCYLPNDLEDANRLDFQHFYLKELLMGNYWAPLRQPRAILDVAGGTGRWAIEMAKQFPDAQVVCLDIVSPPNDYLQSAGGIPANYRFVEHDILQGLPFAEDSFDFVHRRLTFNATPSTQWPAQITELVRVTHQGGWIESVEGGTFRFVGPAVATRQLLGWALQMAAKRGIDPTYGQYVPNFFKTVMCSKVIAAKKKHSHVSCPYHF